ncbi:MAG: helix-turn-helix transcriptional regulator [Polyangia bacterium]|jgi:transcriptional regulator with XRE-family HTH domain
MPRRNSPDADAKAIGRRIRALRREAGLTQEKLAYESDLGSKGYLSDIEHGLALPTVKTLRVLAERLDVLPLDLITNPAAGLRQKLIDRTRGLTAGALRKLLRQLPPPRSPRGTP